MKFGTPAHVGVPRSFVLEGLAASITTKGASSRPAPLTLISPGHPIAVKRPVSTLRWWWFKASTYGDADPNRVGVSDLSYDDHLSTKFKGVY